MREITTGRKHSLGDLRNYYAWNEGYFPPNIMRMTFISNHDKNAWEGTEFEQFGPGLNAAIVLSCVGEGMPLVYNGQEAGNHERLKFFEKDPIVWKQDPEGDLYQKLIALKMKNTALWNAQWGARMIDGPNSAPNAVFSFVRQNDKEKVFAVINFSAKPQTVTFKDNLYYGTYTEYLSGQATQLDASSKVALKPWESKIFVK